MALVNAAIGALLLDDVVSGGVWVRRLSGTLPMLFAMNAVVLASAGVATQISQRPGRHRAAPRHAWRVLVFRRTTACGAAGRGCVALRRERRGRHAHGV